MIMDFLLNTTLGIVSTILSALPDVPALSTQITEPLADFLPFLIAPFRMTAYLLGTPLFLACVATIMITFVFLNAYKFIMWTLRKIPFTGIE